MDKLENIETTKELKKVNIKDLIYEVRGVQVILDSEISATK